MYAQHIILKKVRFLKKVTIALVKVVIDADYYIAILIYYKMNIFKPQKTPKNKELTKQLSCFSFLNSKNYFIKLNFSFILVKHSGM
jgi:hypothetical protein